MAYLSCDLVENAILFFSNSLMICCYALSNGYDGFRILDNYHGQEIDWEYVMELKAQFRNRFAQNDIPQICLECPRLKVKEWKNSDKFNYILISHWSNCNLKCIYCYTRENKKELNKMKPYKMFPVLKDAIRNKLLTDGCWIDISGGEPTELKEFPNLMKLILEETNAFCHINTSGIIYSKAIRKGLEMGRVSPTISLDSGCRETYKRIKNYDYFGKVINNIKKYKKGLDTINNSFVSLKYIFIPGVNDNLTELQNWLNLVNDLEITNLKLEIEHEWYVKNKYIPDNIKEHIAFVQEFVHKNKINLSYRELLVHYGYRDEIHYIDNGLWYNHY